MLAVVLAFSAGLSVRGVIEWSVRRVKRRRVLARLDALAGPMQSRLFGPY